MWDNDAKTTAGACRWSRDRLPLLAGDDLIGPDRRLVERHLRACPDCRTHLDSLSSAVDVLHAVAANTPAISVAPIWPDLSRQIRESRRSPRALWPRLVLGTAGALAASVLVLVGALSVRPFAALAPPSQVAGKLSPPRSTIEQAAADRPLEVAADDSPRAADAIASNRSHRRAAEADAVRQDATH